MRSCMIFPHNRVKSRSEPEDSVARLGSIWNVHFYYIFCQNQFSWSPRGRFLSHWLSWGHSRLPLRRDSLSPRRNLHHWCPSQHHLAWRWQWDQPGVAQRASLPGRGFWRSSHCCCTSCNSTARPAPPSYETSSGGWTDGSPCQLLLTRDQHTA